jgi:titin
MPLPTWLARIRWPIPSSWSRHPRQARALFYRPHLEVLEGRWLPSTFLVTNTADAGAGSLRQAILDANALSGTNEIDFAIGEGGAQTIHPTSALPQITHSVIIDGTTQSGFAGSPLIDLDGADVTPGTNGLVIKAGNSTVKGLAITGFRINDPDAPDFSTAGLLISGSGNVIQGNYLGTDLTGTQPMGNGIGVWIESGSNNLIGGKAAGQGNLISDNGYGVYLSGSGTVVQGNFIGTDVTGTQALGDLFGQAVGVVVNGSNNLIGGETAAARNLISGNGYAGIRIVGGKSNQVQGNYIGTDVTGTQAVANSYGVILQSGSNQVGGTDAGAGNLISGNQATGVLLDGVGGSLVQGNFVGTDVTGTQALGNYVGVDLEQPSGGNLIGGTAAGASNLISGNRLDGVHFYFGTLTGNTVQGNYIGTDATGTQALGNARRGVFIEGGSNNLIGGTAAGAGNLISANQGSGIYIVGPGSGNLVQGNLIGTDATGTQDLGNSQDGVHIDGLNSGKNNTVGGEAAGAGNTIAFNGRDGVLVDRGSGNAILGNAIFANANLGIELLRSANKNQAAPLITLATSDGTTTTVEGTLSSAPNTTFTLEIFANDVSDSGLAQGKRFLGSVVVTTDADGNASFTATFDTAIDLGAFITATATDPANNTSQFSAGVKLTG